MADDVQDTAATGLTSAQAARRLAEDGPNAIADIAQHPIRRALGKFWAPIPWLLEAAIVLQLALGDDIEAAAVAVLLVALVALGFVAAHVAHVHGSTGAVAGVARISSPRP